MNRTLRSRPGLVSTLGKSMSLVKRLRVALCPGDPWWERTLLALLIPMTYRLIVTGRITCMRRRGSNVASPCPTDEKSWARTLTSRLLCMMLIMKLLMGRLKALLGR